MAALVSSVRRVSEYSSSSIDLEDHPYLEIAGPAEFGSGARFLVANREVSELEIAFLFDGSSHKAMTSN